MSIKLLLVSLVFLLICHTKESKATNPIDSLLILLDNQKNDTNKVNLLVQLAKDYISRDMDKAKEYSDSVYSLSKKLNFIPGIADFYYLNSAIQKRANNIDSSNFYIQKAMDLSQSFDDKLREAHYYRYYAILLKNQGYVNSAMNYYYKSLELYIEIDDSLGVAKSYNSIGLYYYQYAKYDSAIVYFIKSIRKYESINLTSGLVFPYINISKSYSHLKEYHKTEIFLNKALVLSKESQNTQMIALALTDLGLNSIITKDYDKAIEYIDLSHEQFVKVNDSLGIGYIYNSKGNIYDGKGMYALAHENYQKAFEIFQSINDKFGENSALKNLALIQERYGNYDKALQLYDTILKAERENNWINDMSQTYYNIYQTHVLAKNYEQAFKYQTHYYELKDSIFSSEKVKIIADLELSYQKEKDQAEILELNNTNLQKDLDLKNKKNQINLGLAAGLIAIIIFFFYRSRVRKNKIIAQQKIKQLEEEKKLLAAKSLVEGQEEERKRIAKELHDGLGVLLSATKLHFTNIIDPGPENKEIIKKAEKLLEQASGDVRKISHNMMPGLLTKYGLLETLKDLFESLADSPGLNARFQLLGEYTRQVENTEIMIYRIVQEMVNNTIKHAEAKNISLIINFLPEQINIQYSDDGKGFDPLEKLGSKSIGLNSIQSRVNFLSGEVFIDSKAGAGTIYNIQVPLTQ